MSASYDEIGIDYARLRRPDPRIAAMITAALGPAKVILNVGAGAGSYEPEARRITAVEPSVAMIRQRPASNAIVVQGVAEALPFADASFDAAMAILTLHHWRDQARGLAEMRRVTRGPIVLLTYDAAVRGFWLADYTPELVTLDEGQFPAMTAYRDWLGPVEIVPVPIPHDCIDGFLCAWWRRPAAYLDPRIRAAISSFWKIGDVTPALRRLGDDLANGAWQARYGSLLTQDSADFGYRLVTAH
jgi:SAM-dependent methyltransferase